MDALELKKEKRRAYDKARRLRLKEEAAAATTTAPKAEAKKPLKLSGKKKTVKVSKKKGPIAKKSSNDIVSEYLKVGDTKEIKSKSRGNLGAMVDAEVIKIYACGSTKKDYVRLKDEAGNKHHKLLSSFAPAE